MGGCRLVFAGDLIDAMEAERIVIVDEVVPHEELMRTAEDSAQRIVKNAPLAVKLTKCVLYRGANALDLASQVGYEIFVQNILVNSEDFKERTKSFLEKAKK